jgi:DNA polymerase-1
MNRTINDFEQVWTVDFEFHQPDGKTPVPICLVAREIKSQREVRQWHDEFCRHSQPPYAIGKDALFVAYYASAEIGCHLSLGWEAPHNILDLYVEFRNQTNGLVTPCGSGLLGALVALGLEAVAASEKDEMRMLAVRGGPYSPDERRALLDYCASDVHALGRLLPRMSENIDLSRALLRGKFMAAAAAIERRGVPVDVQSASILRERWDSVKASLIGRIDVNFGVFEEGSFKQQKFEAFLQQHKIEWPRLESGALDLKSDTFRDMSKSHPKVEPLRQLRDALSEMRLKDLPIGHDGRNRCLLSAFRARTSRNQPSNAKSIFGPAVWLRSLILAKPGWGLAYLDWSQQEFGIAAALSQDGNMIAAYQSGDPYFEFARQAGAVPRSAMPLAYPSVREQFKACVLAVQYAMGEESLGRRIGQPPVAARELLRMHHATYQTFWKWSDAAVDCAMLLGRLWTVFGWNVHVEGESNPRFLRNFPMQANGAEMLRVACIMATARGVRICAPVHDAVLIEAPIHQMDEAIAVMQQAMADASAAVLGGFRLRSDVKKFLNPHRYTDPRGTLMWKSVWEAIGIEPDAIQS